MATKHPSFRTHALALTGMASACILAGCRAHQMGVLTSEKTAEFVDATWLAATKSCWPELEHDGFSTAAIEHNLADPLRFRSTFPSYAAHDENNIRGMVMKPLVAAPTPDATVLLNSRTPVLTRAQAISGSGPHAALVQNNNGIAPPDALCSIHAGSPVGFK